VSRFLIVTLPLTGHVNPAVGVSQALARRGHDVAWAGPETALRPAVGDSEVIYPTGLRLYRAQGDHGLTSVKSLWDGFLLPLAKFTLAAVDKAIAEYRPDVVLVDQHALAGALAARWRGVSWATLAPSAMELTRPYRSLPGVERWVGERLASLSAWAERLWAGREDAGGEPAGGTGRAMPFPESFSLLYSPSLVLACTTTALAGPGVTAAGPAGGGPPPGQVVPIGPVLTGRPPGPGFGWEWLDPARRHVLITVGTLAADIATGFCERAMAAVAPLAERVQAILVAPPGTLPDPPANVLVADRVPMLDLMPHLHAVVCHAGMNTVCEALAHGVPLVVAPIRHDQPVAAAQVAAAGAGLRVPFTRVRPGELRAAVAGVLDDPAYVGGAKLIRESFISAGGEGAAAGHLARLAAGQSKYP
jgi:UDP:flavonoid glycosyltransferase YjiC (YdhE family)